MNKTKSAVADAKDARTYQALTPTFQGIETFVNGDTKSLVQGKFDAESARHACEQGEEQHAQAQTETGVVLIIPAYDDAEEDEDEEEVWYLYMSDSDSESTATAPEIDTTPETSEAPALATALVAQIAPLPQAPEDDANIHLSDAIHSFLAAMPDALAAIQFPDSSDSDSDSEWAIAVGTTAAETV